ncbi:MAG TPA: polysaccharide deacetylase family protein, partial [Gemmatimonadales bacterium]|nr:polysaccharide deacetylase family protein [Gemmatimonadales bacterium]
ESMQKLPDVPARVHALGHRLGNHTWTHYYGGLAAQLRDGGDIVEEMTRTTARLDAIVGAESLTFRPPYGYWDAQVAAMLNAAAPLRDRHVGPFNWRIPTSMDLADWKGGVTASIPQSWRAGIARRQVL